MNERGALTMTSDPSVPLRRDFIIGPNTHVLNPGYEVGVSLVGFSSLTPPPKKIHPPFWKWICHTKSEATNTKEQSKMNILAHEESLCRIYNVRAPNAN